MKRKLLVSLLALSLFAAMALPAFATETEIHDEVSFDEPLEFHGTCGENLTWELEDTTIIISGEGEMEDYPDGAPWHAYRQAVKTVIFSGKVTKVGENAFYDHDSLTGVNFGESIVEIGKAAFKSCDALTTVSLPKTFRTFGEEAFMSCESLTEFHFKSGMPRFNLNCLWDTYAKLYYPENNPWPLQHIEQLESAFQGRIEFLSSDGTDPYVPTAPAEEEEPETTEATEETTEPATVPTTQPETQPVTQATEPEVTEAMTEETAVATTEASEETKPEEESRGVSGVMVGICIISGVLSLVLLGMLVFRRKRYL